MKTQNLSAEIPKTPELADRIVVKVGSNVVVRPDGKVALGLLYSIVEQIANLRRGGREVLLVTSGAVALGVERIGLAARPTLLARVQACAAIGQSRLMSIYDDAFANLDLKIAQVLLTEDDFRDEVRYANLRATLDALLELGVIPIINENDTVSTMELERPGAERIFGDNDKLSALVMAHVGADLLILLSDVDGLYSGTPGQAGVELLSSIGQVTDEIRGYAHGGNGRGRGGMASKIEAASVAMEAGGCAVIANGRTPGIIERICDGEPIGTLFAHVRRSV